MMPASPPLLLVLAWDDSLPAGPLAAPTLPLLRALAIQRPLLAVLPHLPTGAQLTAGADLPSAPPPAELLPTDQAAAVPSSAAEATIPEEMHTTTAAQETPAASAAADVAPEPPAAEAAPAAGPPAGVLLLTNPPARATTTAPAYPSRVLGLAEALPALPTTAGPGSNPAAVVPAASGFQLRQPLREQPARARQAPAAPYQGRAEAAPPELVFGPAPSLTGSLPEAPATSPGLAATVPAVESGKSIEAAPDTSLKPGTANLPGQAEPVAPAAPEPAAAEPPTLDNADRFAEAETGPAEAADLNTAALAAETNAGPADASSSQPAYPPTPTRLPIAPARASLAQGLAALGPNPFALADDLHYRIIQYARFAAPLVTAQGQSFGLIYAASWPTWLAALELRYQLRCPLVLHLSALAADQAAPASPGWLRELERYALRRTQAVLVPTEALAQRVISTYRLAPEQVLVVAADDPAALAAALQRFDKG